MAVVVWFHLNTMFHAHTTQTQDGRCLL